MVNTNSGEMMNYNEILQVAFRTIVFLIILFLMTKIMGKKQVSQLNIFDYIVGITIGSLVADISLDVEKSFFLGIVTVVIYGLFDTIISFLAIKSMRFRRFFEGTPTTIVENGKIIEKGLKKVKFNVNDLLVEARNAGYFNLEEIEYAIMESNGKISFLPTDKAKPVTKKDMNLKVNKASLVANVIIDGNIMEHNLQVMAKDKKWLLQNLSILGYKKIENILLATLDNNEKIVVYEKDVHPKYSTILE